MVSNETVIQVRVGEISMGTDGIIRGIVTWPINEETLADAVEIIAAIKKLSQDKPRPFYSDVRKVQSVTKAARDYFARPENQEFIRANAILVHSPLNRMLANFYLRVNKPTLPTQMFTQESDAINWLRTYLER